MPPVDTWSDFLFIGFAFVVMYGCVVFLFWLDGYFGRRDR